MQAKQFSAARQYSVNFHGLEDYLAVEEILPKSKTLRRLKQLFCIHNWKESIIEFEYLLISSGHRCMKCGKRK